MCLSEVMERTFRRVTSSRRYRGGFVFLVVFTWIIALYYMRNSNIISTVKSSISRLHFFNEQSADQYTSTVDELDHTIGIIRYRNCLIQYANKAEKCRFFDLCNRYSSNMSQTTGCEKRLPDCVVIGVYKAGTRALVDFLSMHPRVVVRKYPNYELQFFDKHYQKGVDWYRNEMPFSMPDQITIEKTPSYFQSELAPERIFNTNPNTKLVLMVRNPLDRAISHFTYDSYVAQKQYGGLMKNCIFDPWRKFKVNKNCFAVKYSIYDEAMVNYLKFFRRENILIVEYEDFIKDPFSVLQTVEDFLHLEHAIQKKDLIFNKNKGYFCLKENSGSKVQSCYDPTRGRAISDQRYQDMGKPLQEFFAPHNAKFFKLIGRNISSWNDT